ncbi:MAG: DUF1294 domain-containing protein [Ruminococcaceae bacterium]|nr:DUF1294 domain-containing protein [Oscillospiraceae bacterium]
MEKYVFLYFCFVFLVSAIITFSDKIRAKKGIRRIRERTLLLWGFFGGAAVMYITMLLIRHKTRHFKFMFLLPLFTIVHIILLYVILK